MTFRSLFLSITIFTFALCFYACRENQDRTSEESNSSISDSLNGSRKFKPLGDFLPIDRSVQQQLRSFTVMKELEDEMRKFSDKLSGDLSFSVDQLQKIDEKIVRDSLPGKLNQPEVKSRLTLMRTYIGLLKAQLDRHEPDSVINRTRKELFDAYNAFRYQVSDVMQEKIYEDFLDTLK